ncbi:MAG: SDR family NAD(P)-dependent oxidoreductase, partial [Kiloniellales bacterium]
MDFTGKRVLETGGTRGVGRAIVEAFLAAGARVAVNGTSQQSVDTALAQLASGDAVVAAPGDLGMAAGCRQTMDAALQGLGGLDVLVNNAGINRDGPLLAMSEDEWDSVLAVNLKAPFLLTQQAGQAMLENGGGCIVNIAALTGLEGRKDAVNYCCAKAGLLMLTKCAALELGPTVRVNAVGLGFVESPLVEELYGAE